MPPSPSWSSISKWPRVSATGRACLEGGRRASAGLHDGRPREPGVGHGCWPGAGRLSLGCGQRLSQDAPAACTWRRVSYAHASRLRSGRLRGRCTGARPSSSTSRSALSARGAPCRRSREGASTPLGSCCTSRREQAGTAAWAVWGLSLPDEVATGNWIVETKVDGEPAGIHASRLGGRVRGRAHHER